MNYSKSSVYQISYKANFITHCCKSTSLCKQTNWYFLSINWFWRTVSCAFRKDIKEWKKIMVFFFNSKFYIFMLTVKKFKNVFCTFHFQTCKKYHLHNAWENFSFVNFLQPFLFVIANKQFGKDTPSIWL